MLHDARRTAARHKTSAVSRILVIDPDLSTIGVLREVSATFGFECIHAPTAAHGRDLSRTREPDLVLVDLDIRGGRGFACSATLRAVDGPAVIVLTSAASRSNKFRAFNLGADDVVLKPFDHDELIARARAVLRRRAGNGRRLHLGAAIVHLHHQRVRTSLGSVTLTRRECDLLQYLADHVNRVVPRDELLREVWGYPDVPMTRSVDNAVARLRKKIEANPRRPHFIQTAHGDGYCLTTTPTGRLG